MLEALRDYHRRTGASHFHSSQSVLPILQSIKARMKPMDACVLSKGHAESAYLLVFGETPDEAFWSLGSGIGFGIGLALADPDSMVYVVCGDGEMQEGSCSEALLCMSRLGIKNIEVHVDGNGMQAFGNVPVPVFPVVFYHPTYKGEDWTCHYANA